MKFFIKKLITLIITLLVISFLTFTAFSVIPGDAALSRLGKDATEEQLERARDEMGLNDPLLERYGRWVTDAMQGDFGESYRYEGTSVRSLLAQRLPVTVLLAVISLLIITVISVPLGILSARFAGKWVDTLTNCLTQILMAVPSFFLGMILTYVFGLILHMFQPGKFIEPSENFGKSAQYLLFPALAVALPKIAMVVKFLRSSILTEMNREYVRTAYSRGNTETAVLYGHVLKNAMIPIITVLGSMFGSSLGGALIIETIFSIPGMGTYLTDAISKRDYPIIQGGVLFISICFCLIMLIVDIIYAFVDPRIRSQYAGKGKKKQKKEVR